MTIRTLLRSSIAAFAAAVLMHGGVVAATDLAVCIDSASPTATIDARLAQAIADDQGRTLHLHRYDGTGGERGYRLRNYAEMVDETCELVLGFPFAGADGLPAGVNATKAYARTGFIMLARSGEPVSDLAHLPEKTAVAVTFNTTPNLWFDAHPNLVREIFETDAESIAAVRARKVGVAMLWRPSAIRQLETDKRLKAFGLSAIDEPGAQWNLVALFGERSRPQMATFDAAIERLRGNGKLQEILGAYADTMPARSSALVVPRHPHGSRRARSDVALASSCATAEKSPQKKPSGKSAKGPPALFTAAQAELGKPLYIDKCAFCHAPDMNGRSGPALRGKFFAAPSHKYVISDIFTIVSQNMPATSPGSLEQDDYVKIMSYILLNNGYPPGPTEMTFDVVKVSKVPLRFYGE